MGQTSFDVEKALRFAKSHAPIGGDSKGYCGRYTMNAIAAGLSGERVRLRPNNAYAFGYLLIQLGFRKIGVSKSFIYPYELKKGDVVVIAPFAHGTVDHNPYGHMAIWDGSIWISDFRQRSATPGCPYPGPNYRKHKPVYQLYRWDPSAAELKENVEEKIDAMTKKLADPTTGAKFNPLKNRQGLKGTYP